MRISQRAAHSLQQITLAIACAALAISTTACTKATGSFDRTLSVSGPVTLHISTGSGDIHILPGDPSQVHIVARVTSWAPFHAQARVSQVENNPPIEQSGSTIDIGRNTPNNVSIDYDVTVPSSTQLSAHTGSGDVRILNIAGSPGGITNASTGSGDIQADGLGGQVSLHTGSGDIHASLENSSQLTAQTGSGDIILKNVQGSLVARTGSGDIDVTGTPSGGWNLHTGSGNVTLHTGSAHFSLDASTGSGSVHSDQSISTHGTFDHHHLTGDINGGGPSVHIGTGSGDINIH